MPADYLALGSLLGFAALLFLTMALLYRGRIAAVGRLGCAAIGLPAAAVIGMFFLVLSAMSEPHTAGNDAIPFLLGGAPVVLALLGVAALSARAPRGDRSRAMRRSYFAAFAGCAVLALAFLALVLLTARSIHF